MSLRLQMPRYCNFIFFTIKSMHEQINFYFFIKKRPDTICFPAIKWNYSKAYNKRL
jgi:hypothetical protein